MTVILSGGKILGSGGGVLSIGAGAAPAAPAFARIVNQGGASNDKNSSHSVTNVCAGEWPDVAGATSYNVRRYTITASGLSGATLLTGSNGAQRLSGNASISGNTLTASTPTSGTWFPGVRFAAAGLLAQSKISWGTVTSQGTQGVQAQISGTAGQSGTYNVNQSQTLASTTFTANYFVDSTATDCTRPAWDSPGVAYRYSVSAVNASGESAETPFDIAMYEHGVTNWGCTDLDFGSSTTSYFDQTNVQAGSVGCMKNFYSSGGVQPGANGEMCPVDIVMLGGMVYVAVDIYNPNNETALNQGAAFKITDGGDHFGWFSDLNPNWFSTATQIVRANGWSTWYKLLSAAPYGVGFTTATGCSITNGAGGAGNILNVPSQTLGGIGVVDNTYWISGAGIAAGTYLYDRSQNASIGQFLVGNGSSAGAPVPVSLNLTGLTLTFFRQGLYKTGSTTGSNNQTLYMDNWRFGVNVPT